MFKPSDQVVCVDDTNPNPNSTYPSGYVVAGSTYTVMGIADEGGVIIQGKPVIGRNSGQEAGWKRRRFRRVEEKDGQDEELVAVGASKA